MCEGVGFCGDGRQDRGEQCGEPGLNCPETQACDTRSCLCSGAPECGNGKVERGEQCGEPGLTCPTGQTCASTTCLCSGGSLCGNGTVERGEQCGEPGLSCAAGQTCTTQTCLCATPPGTFFVCGNGRLDAGEECDDGNKRDFDGCSFNCLRERGVCGDGTVQKLLGEQCEPTNFDRSLPYVCGPDCRFRSFFCGNGIRDAGEECDDGTRNADTPNARCRTTCSVARCGDGIVDAPNEKCDDGNRLSGDGCDRFCQVGVYGTQAFVPSDGTISYPPISPVPPLAPVSMPPGSTAIANLTGMVQGMPLQQTGPAAVAVMAAGAAAGYAWVRRRRNR